LIRFSHRGSFDNSEKFLKRTKNKNYRQILERYAAQGLAILRSATPQDSGLTSDSWGKEIVIKKSGFSIYWTNNNMADNGVPVVILLQYGHGTRSGSFVEGKDFINPVMRPLFDNLSENLWKEVISL
jgi:hypothetical protein